MSRSSADFLGVPLTAELEQVSGEVFVEFNADGTYQQSGTGTYESVSNFGGSVTTETFTTDHNQSGEYTLTGNILKGLNTSSDPNAVDADSEISISGDVMTIEIIPFTYSLPNPLGDSILYEISGSSTYSRQ